MRTITLIIVHCSATPEGKDFKLEDIDRWHRQRGWKGCGYHYVVELDGTVRTGRDESVIGAHCKNHNKHSIGVCYVGGNETSLRPCISPDGKSPKGEGAITSSKAKDTRTEAQKEALRKLIADLKRRYPKVLVLGHRDLDPQKECPCFDVLKEL